MLEVEKANIVTLKVDAIVNAANKTLLGGGGVDGAIHAAAGKELLEECKTLGGCQTGEAKITKGYKLPAKYIIHTVGPIYRFHTPQEDEKLLTECYENSLRLAEKYNVKSIAFSSISAGVYGYPKRDAAKVAVNTARKWEKDHPEMKIIFCVFDDENLKIYRELLSEK